MASVDTFITGTSGVLGARIAEVLSIDSPRLDITKDVGWPEVLSGRRRVVHCAAVASSRGIDDARVHEVNVAGAKRVAWFAREAGVKRFVFISTVKVFGESTREGQIFSDSDPVNPVSVYAQSKALAEEELRKLHQPGVFDVVILRPTVVLSPSAKGAVGAMIKYARRGILPFPVSTRSNLRDFVSLDNLVDAVICALNHPDAGGQSFSVTDGGAVSTRELYLAIAASSGRKGRLFRIPATVIQNLAGVLGKHDLIERIFGNLEVDSSLIQSSLGWQPMRGTLEYAGEAFRPAM